MSVMVHLERLDDRSLLMLLGGVAALLFAAGIVYLVVPEYKALNMAVETRANMRETVSKGKAVYGELESLAEEVAELRQRVHGDMANRPLKQMESYIIGRLQKISWQHNIELRGVAPGPGRSVQMFKEIVFDVELVGDYFDLVAWLRELSGQLGFVVVKEYRMRPLNIADDEPQLVLNLKMVSYRLVSDS
ncbi:MAG: type 4a pilus biogenesis protein PilO [Gammaproteobacteria bacterium]|nr:type 4a pilus biogenesis protein PilO [Gammaproteobacteria bacterium]